MDLQTTILARLLVEENLFFEHYENIPESIFTGQDKEIFISLKKHLLSGKRLNTVVIAENTGNVSALQRIQELILSVDYNTDLETILHSISKQKKENELIQFSNDLLFSISQNKGNPDSVFADINKFVNSYGNTDSSKLLCMDDHVSNVLSIVEHNQVQTGLTGVPTGLRTLNNRTNGLQGGDLIVVAGETSQGKTSLALGISNTASDYNSVHFISMEMTANQLTSRLMAMASNINSNKILTSKLEENDLLMLSSLSENVRPKKLWIDSDTSDIDKIIANIRRRKTIYETKLVVIDYLQLVRSKGTGNKEQKVADTTRRLKNLAIELDIPIILISQLSRDRDRPFPRLARLRDSGQIEEAADIVIFVYRPSFYGKEFFDDNVTRAEGMAQIIVAKGRNIGTGTFFAKFDESLTKFTEDGANRY